MSPSFYIESPDQNNTVDGTVRKNILQHLNQNGPADVTIVPISWFPDFKFKPPMNGKRYCLMDFMEQHSPSDEYLKFWEWVYENPPFLWFKRESEGVFGTTIAIEWPVYLPVPATVSRAEFEVRPITVFNNWGFSHPSRPNFHADVFRGMNDGLEVIGDFSHLRSERGTSPLWLSIHTPHYARQPITTLMEYQNKSKVAVSLWGNGKKCFRHGEACVGSIMALQEDNLQWSYPWVHGENCIRLRPGEEYKSLRESLDSLDLYPIYAAGQAMARKYYAPDYTRDWIIGSIIKRL